MKKLLLGFITIMLFATACKKTECPDPPVVIPPVNLSGTTWNGLANVPGVSLTNKPFVLTFNGDGTLSGNLTNGTPFAINGTWNLTPNSTTVKIFFTLATVTGNYIGQGTLNSNNTKLESGIATNVTSPTYNLNFAVTKS
jgi:hypothetical protein